VIDPKAEPEPAPAALSEYEKERLAIQKNRERLKAERLARESDGPSEKVRSRAQRQGNDACKKARQRYRCDQLSGLHCNPSTVWIANHGVSRQSERIDLAICRCSLRTGPGGNERAHLMMIRRRW
jgi:hypothetical protein